MKSFYKLMLRRRMIKKRRPRKTQKARKETLPGTPSAKPIQPPVQSVAAQTFQVFKTWKVCRSACFPPNAFSLTEGPDLVWNKIVSRTSKECEECGYDAVSDKSSADIFRAFRVFRGQCVTSVINIDFKSNTPIVA